MGSLSDEVRTEVLCGRICYLEAENAKLRELVRKLDIAIATAYVLQRPPTSADVLIAHEDDDLGIEVDE